MIFPQVINANRLDDGHVVFWTETGEWVTFLEEATLLWTQETLTAALSHAQGAEKQNLVIDPYAIPLVQKEEGQWSAVALRDKIRTQGPTVHEDHGKQAQIRQAHKG